MKHVKPAIIGAAVCLVIDQIAQSVVRAAPNRTDTWTTTTPALSLAVPSSCAFASITADDSVIIDWSCVQIQAAEYKARRSMGLTSSFAFVLESLRNGTAIVK